MYLKGKKELDVHVFSDQSSLEIYTNGYQNNHSNNIFAGDVQDQIRIRAYGGPAVIREYEAYGMRSCQELPGYCSRGCAPHRTASGQLIGEDSQCFPDKKYSWRN